MQDRISPNSKKSSCNARPDHTFESGADITRHLADVPPEKRISSDATGMCALCHQLTSALASLDWVKKAAPAVT